MVPLGDGDAQPKTTEVVKKQTPIGITEKNRVIDKILKVPVMTKKLSIKTAMMYIFETVSRHNEKKRTRKERDGRDKRMEEETS